MDAPGGTFFLTIVTYARTPLFADRVNVELLRSIVAAVKRERPFAIPGAVILPDHLHFMWELPAGDGDFSTRVGLVKARFTKALRGHPAAHRGGFDLPHRVAFDSGLSHHSAPQRRSCGADAVQSLRHAPVDLPDDFEYFRSRLVLSIPVHFRACGSFVPGGDDFRVIGPGLAAEFLSEPVLPALLYAPQHSLAVGELSARVFQVQQRPDLVAWIGKRHADAFSVAKAPGLFGPSALCGLCL
jgi:REP element-mobilizing transposase RayT